ncbi:MAG: hypothetical protein IKH27_03760 [Oscillospiraceae bacterium]|nr:hypothetical protein [Oscillospiraceae bacterium]MBR3446901.1 hypothetical protein [Oscillospiraceae bacterium]
MNLSDMIFRFPALTWHFAVDIHLLSEKRAIRNLSVSIIIALYAAAAA